jgi:hypothetical protein
MGLGNWVKQLFSPSGEESGSDAGEEASGAVITGGIPGLAGLEVAEAADAEARATEPPQDPAP